MEYKKEVKEALVALKNARKTLKHTLDKLNSAKNWGFWDILGGGGFISSLIKFNKIDDSQKMIEELNRDMRILEKELKDINISTMKFAEVSNINRAFDIFFDNIFSDISTQSMIKENIINLEKMDTSLEKLEIKLRRELDH